MIRFLLAFALTIAALPVRAIEIQEITSPGGIDAWLVQENSIPFVAVELVFDGGATLDLPGKRGATNLMMALIEEGSGDLDARAFQEEREALAASFSFRTYDDSVSVSAVVLTENRAEAMALLRDALINPRFDDDAIERVRAQVQAGLRADVQDPNSIAGQAFDVAAFGDHPYGTPIDGTQETVAGLTQEDMFDAHRNAFTTGRVHVGAAGDITAEELGALIDELIGDLPADGPDLPGRVDFALEGGVTIVPFETPQSVALFGHAGIERDDEDFFAAFILNEVLGGSGLESRLMREVREKRGLTYGIGTFLYGRDYGDLVMGQVATANDKAAETIAVIRDEWQSIQQNGVSAAELQAAKTYLTGAYPLRFDGNAPIARILVGMQRMGLAPDYIATRNDRINALTLDDVNRVAAQLFSPQDLHFTVVGQPVGLGE